RLRGERVEERVRRRRPGDRLNAHFPNRHRSRPANAEVACLGLRQVHVVATTAAAANGTPYAPARAVIGKLDDVLRRRCTRGPVESQTAELARAGEVQSEPGLSIGGALPVRG